jgi:hypothetical protein
MRASRTINVFPPDRVTASCLVIGAVLFALSTFFWSEGEFGVHGGALIAVAMVFWIYLSYRIISRSEPQT